MKHPEQTLSLVADIGGTNTRCALAHGKDVLTETIRRYSNAEFTGLEMVLRQYLSDEDNVDPIAASVAVAGPVQGNVGSLTNLDWRIDTDTLAAATKAETVAILNDLQAQGHALPHLKPDAVNPVIRHGSQSGHKATTRLVVGVGTGFNAAAVYETPSGILVPPSESGHAGLPAGSTDDLRLTEFLSKNHGFSAIEDALSGRGLERLYSYVSQNAGELQTLSAQGIMEACVRGDDPRAAEAVALFVRTLGKVCGDLALIQLPFAGIYLVGGVARAVAPYLDRFGFAETFLGKGRFSDFMTGFDVSVVEDDYAALIGSAAHLDGVVKQR